MERDWLEELEAPVWGRSRPGLVFCHGCGKEIFPGETAYRLDEATWCEECVLESKYTECGPECRTSWDSAESKPPVELVVCTSPKRA